MATVANTDLPEGNSNSGEFKRGWQIVLASMLGIGLGLSPLPMYTTGMFAPHLAQEFGWNMGQIMFGITITTLVLLFAGPAMGPVVSRFGVRKVALTSLVLFSLSFMSLGLSNGSLWLYYTTWVLATLTGAGTLPITWTRSVNQWFDKHKGLALGLSMMGTGLFGIFSKPYVTWLIEEFGWRAAFVGVGMLPLVIAFPAAYFLFRDPKVQTQSGEAKVAKVKPGGMTAAETFRDWRFWLLSAAFLAVSFALGGPVPNMEGMLKTAGIPQNELLGLTPIIGFSALMGRFVGGWLVDRMWAPAVGFVLLSLPAISCFMLTGDNISFEYAAVAIFMIGFALGIEYDLMAYLVCRYFGLKSYATTYGIIYVFFALGAGFGPLLFGRNFDKHGNYDQILTISAGALFIGAALLLLLGRYRTFADEPAE